MRTYSMNIKIVQADLTSPKQAKVLLYLLDNYARDPMGGGLPLSNYVKENLAEELIKRPHAFTVFAYVEGKPAGLINCFEAFSTFTCKPLVNIHDVIVLAEYRGKSISQRMLKKIEEMALERGCCKLTLEILEGNQTAINAYKKFGFSAYELDPRVGKAVFWQKKLK